MGGAVSTNSTKIITKSILNISSDIIQESKIKQDQEVVITAENVGGSVNIDNANIEQTQQINSRNLFKSLNSEENNQKVNQEIEKITKSLITGLNLGQVATSISSLNDIIDNCINIKNSSLINCSLKTNQTFKILEKDIEKDLNINNLNVNQLSTSVFDCISNVSSSSNISSETDMKIKQISSASAEGLDMKWLAIAGAVGVVGVGVTGASLLKKLLGPIISTIGGYLSYRQYMLQNANKVASSFVYLKHPLTFYDKQLSLISTKDQKSDNFLDYGDADVYECSNKTISLYKGTFIKNLVSDITYNDLTFEVEGNTLKIGIKNSDRYTKTKDIVISGLENINTVYRINTVSEAKNDEKTQHYTGDLFIDLINFNNTKKIHIYYFKNKEKIYYTNFDLNPTILGIKYKNSINFLDLAEKDTLFLIGLGMLISGIILTIFLNKTG